MAPPWLGWLIAASILRQAGVTTGAHLAAINLGLKTIPVDRRTGGAADCSGLREMTGRGRFRAWAIL
ncbi:DUF1612 domain-containing protein [Rhizobium leguminosarum]|uniref:DUF1612 domain-containing protein n=1 Tax=Rhizobium leguminosarum TaxID=384 RepID=A0A444I4S8_RHILE|nr:DUF1612 domain-containing protein [Rhizobium leguminosarum]